MWRQTPSFTENPYKIGENYVPWICQRIPRKPRLSVYSEIPVQEPPPSWTDRRTEIQTDRQTDTVENITFPQPRSRPFMPVQFHKRAVVVWRLRMVMCSTEKVEVPNPCVKALCGNVVKSWVIIWACGAYIDLNVWYHFSCRTAGRVVLRNYLFSVT